MTDYLTSHQAAARAGITHSYLCRLCREGVIPARKWGRDWQVLPADVDRWATSANHAVGYPAGRKRTKG